MNADAERDAQLRRLKDEFAALRLSDDARARVCAAAVDQAQGRRPVWRLVAFGATAAAVLVLVALGTRQGRSDADIYAIEGRVTTEAGQVAPGARLKPGSVFATPVGAAQVRIGPHAIALAEHSRLQVQRVQAGAVDLDLQAGRVSLTVSPLRAGQHVRVRAGELLVDVVGTAFEVARGPRCSSVGVSRGRVRTEFDGQSEFLSAGQSRTYCPKPVATGPVPVPSVGLSPSPAPEPAEARTIPVPPRVAWVKPQEAPPKRANPAVSSPILLPPPEEAPIPSSAVEADVQAASPAINAKPVPAHTLSVERSADPTSLRPGEAPRSDPASPEEMLFREITRSPLGSEASAALCRTYLQRYPDGLFAEEASWKLLRATYATADNREVIRLAEPFLRRFAASTRANDVRLLYVHSLVELGQAPSRAALDSLLSNWRHLPAAHQEEVIYLAVRSLCSPGAQGACAEWVRLYQTQFPEGRYAAQVKKLAP